MTLLQRAASYVLRTELGALGKRVDELEAQVIEGKFSYSWEGEDRLAVKLFADVFHIEKGFYVDVGASHPINFSTTLALYQRGWRGLNIDAAPGTAALFGKYRPMDTNLEMGVAAEPSRLKFHVMSDPLLSGFLSPETLEAHLARRVEVVATREIDCLPLGTILERHASGREVDLLNIDAEGLDFEILSSLDFRHHRPKVIIAEILGCFGIAEVEQSQICRLLIQQGYELFSRLHYSSFFVDRAVALRR